VCEACGSGTKERLITTQSVLVQVGAGRLDDNSLVVEYCETSATELTYKHVYSPQKLWLDPSRNKCLPQGQSLPGSHRALQPKQSWRCES
jgi:hypothetical protein